MVLSMRALGCAILVSSAMASCDATPGENAAAGSHSNAARFGHRWHVSSPDGELIFHLRMRPRGDAAPLGVDRGEADRGALTYSVVRNHGGEVHDVLLPSDLGVRRDDEAFVDDLAFVGGGRPRLVADHYITAHGKRREVRHIARERIFTFAARSGAHIEIVVRVADDGVAFRYRFPGREPTPRRIIEEVTSFHVSPNARAWIAPQQSPGRFSPAYEALYREMPAGTSAPEPSGWAFPALFRAGDEWLLVTEAGVDDGNAGTRLAANAPDGEYRIRLPEPGEGMGVGAVEPQSTTPWTLPWRVIVAGSSPRVVVESTLVEDVSPPSTVRDASWVRPGRASWSWWSDDNSPRDEAALRRFIDLAAEMRWEYSLIDANWNMMASAALDRVLAHARERGVGILLWYNSGGPHNDVTEQPRELMHIRDVRRAEFARLRDLGIKGVKVDFWHSDKQDRINQYLELLRDAAEFELMVNFHGSTLPRGWSRTYPHLMTMEGVPGAEQYKFNAAYPQIAAWQNTVLVFTRNVVGPMDYTPVTFTDHNFPRITTDGHELALSVVFESALQHFADAVESYRQLPEPAREFLSAVPTAWEETLLLGGAPGQLAVVARRGGDGWYVGGISGLDTPQSFELDLSFLGRGRHSLLLIEDGAGPRQLVSSTRAVTAADRLSLDLLARGGFAARIAPRPR